jgi:hypothetical protein
VTEILGLRLAYRGLIAGLAAGYMWLAAAMVGGLVLAGDPLQPLRLLGGGSTREAVAGGLALLQLGSGAAGMGFAYFFGRYFTVRPTMAVAAPCFALLAWLVLGQLTVASPATQLALLAASLLYGVMLGAAVPVRGELLRSRDGG